MKVERYSIQACCGKKALVFKTDKPLTKDIIVFLVNSGFKEATNFTKAGILYVENTDFIITGPLGTDRLQVKCRSSDCEQKINNLETILINA